MSTNLQLLMKHREGSLRHVILLKTIYIRGDSLCMYPLSDCVLFNQGLGSASPEGSATNISQETTASISLRSSREELPKKMADCRPETACSLYEPPPDSTAH